MQKCLFDIISLINIDLLIAWIHYFVYDLWRTCQCYMRIQQLWSTVFNILQDLHLHSKWLHKYTSRSLSDTPIPPPSLSEFQSVY